MEEKLYWFWLASLNEFSASGLKRLLQYFNNPKRLFEVRSKEIYDYLTKGMPEQEEGLETFLKKSTRAEKIIASRREEEVIKNYNKMNAKGISFITMSESAYPNKLKNIDGAPYWLFYKGDLPREDTPTIAIIGARVCSSYGKEIAMRLAGELSEAGVQIVSGMAAGIDGYAHRGALDAGKKTYGILGCGVDICYPQENFMLYQRILEWGGIISEYAPGVKGLPFHFPMRNRIISAFSDGILVVEARERSGTLITVDCGLEQGKDIFAVPGRIGDRLSEGCLSLIQSGAKLVTKSEDILEELSIISKYKDKEKNGKCKIEINYNNLLETKEKIVYASLSLVPKHMETIVEETKLLPDELIKILFCLELKNMVKQSSGNYYVIQQDI